MLSRPAPNFQLAVKVDDIGEDTRDGRQRQGQPQYLDDAAVTPGEAEGAHPIGGVRRRGAAGHILAAPIDRQGHWRATPCAANANGRCGVSRKTCGSIWVILRPPASQCRQADASSMGKNVHSLKTRQVEPGPHGQKAEAGLGLSRATFAQ